MVEKSNVNKIVRTIWRRARGGFSSVLFWFLATLASYGAIVALTVPTGQFDWATEGRALLTNTLASFLLYYLVVYLPERRRRRALRLACRKMYHRLKEQILFDILQGSQKGGRTDIQVHYELVQKLMDCTEFKKFFEDGDEADEGFYAFRNHIQNDERDFRSIIFKLQLIARQLEFILHTVDIRDQEHLETLKRLEQWLLSLDELHAGYDEEKILDSAIWAIFAGWSQVDGYLGYDPIERAIDKI